MEIKLDKVSCDNLFDNISINIKENSIISIIGKNSSGKTTLLDMINGDRNDYNGSIKENAKTYTFYIKQNYHSQFKSLTILEDIKRLSQNKNKKQILELISEFHLDESILEKSYFELSDSELKIILIICMLLSKSNLLLLDDPTLGLDNKSIKILVRKLVSLKKSNKIIIIASNNSEFILEVTDRICILDKNKTIILDKKYDIYDKQTYIDKSNINIPKIINFKNLVYEKKQIKLMYRDSLNDLLKDIYRNAR